jgi:hypothetical protein
VPAEAALDVQVEDERDQRGLVLVDDEVPVLAPHVAEGRRADRPLAACGLALQARHDAVDDRGPLELGEDAEHLHHHPARGSGGVERLGRRAEGDARLVELLQQVREASD